MPHFGARTRLRFSLSLLHHTVIDTLRISASLHCQLSGRPTRTAVYTSINILTVSSRFLVALLRLCGVLPTASWALGSRLLALLSRSAAEPVGCKPSVGPIDLPSQLLAASKGPGAPSGSGAAVDSGGAPAMSGADPGTQAAWLAAAAALRSACCAPEPVFGISQVSKPCVNYPSISTHYLSLHSVR